MLTVERNPYEAPASLQHTDCGVARECVITVFRMRQQYYFRKSDRGLLAWDVHRLIRLTCDLPQRQVPLIQIRELDEKWLGDDERPSWREIIQHIKLIDEADLSFPIILSASGAVMDGMHRVAKAARLGKKEIAAVQFEADPEPDYIGLGPDDLPYD